MNLIFVFVFLYCYQHNEKKKGFYRRIKVHNNWYTHSCIKLKGGIAKDSVYYKHHVSDATCELLFTECSGAFLLLASYNNHLMVLLWELLTRDTNKSKNYTRNMYSLAMVFTSVGVQIKLILSPNERPNFPFGLTTIFTEAGKPRYGQLCVCYFADTTIQWLVN
jgi:hypothetical protein